MIEVVTLWAPRPGHEKWRDEYHRLLAFHRASVRRVGHRHVVIAEAELAGYETFIAPLPESLMHAILSGQLAYLRAWDESGGVVLMDMDCLVLKDLHAAFPHGIDILLTSRPDPKAPIQNGAMYFAPGSKRAAVALFERALELCGAHWGGDQEAIARAVAPVPAEYGKAERFGARVMFASCEALNHTSKKMPWLHPNRFVEHFKGEQKKWVEPFARDCLGIRLP